MKKLTAVLALATAFSAFSASAQKLAFSTTNLVSGNGPAFLLAVDINGDGHPGLVAANFGFRFGNGFGYGGGSGSTLSVFTNDGYGNLYSNATLTVGSQPVGIAAADVNGDGWVDLICANVGDNTLTVLTNNRQGGFALEGTFPVGQAPVFVAAADVNGDGKMDLISANFGASTITVLTNDGVGGFELSTNIPVGTQPNCLAAVDINGDKTVDLVCANSGGNTLETFTNNGKGVFTYTATIDVPGGAGWVIGADVNGDGKVDLVAAGPTLTVLTNDGLGNFNLKSTAYSSGSGMVVAADMNGDGKVDLICPNNGNGIQGSATVLTNNGKGDFTAAITVPIGIANFVNYPNCVTAADFNDDGNMDFAIDCYASTNYSVTAPSTLTKVTELNAFPRTIVTITLPTNGTAFLTGQSFVVQAKTSMPVGGVELLADGQLFQQTASLPYAFQIPAGSLAAGGHNLQVVALTGGETVGSSAVINITVNSPGTALIDFDSLDTSAGAVGGSPLAGYLAQFGVTMSKLTVGTALEAVNTNSLTGAVQVAAPSAPNFFTQAGLNQPVSFTLNFATPLQSFGFTRIGLSASSGQVSHPQWTATIFDANGNALGSVSEALILGSAPVAARSFVLAGTNIASVRFDSDAQGVAAFPAVLLDNLLLNSNPTAPALSVSLNVVSPPVNNIVAPATIVLSASVIDQLSPSYAVSFFAGATLLGTVTQSPYQITWPNVLPGNYSLQARVTDGSGVAAYSTPVPIIVQLGANSKELNFDGLNTSRGPVTGAALTSYFAGFGVTVSSLSTGTTLTVYNQQQIAGGSAALAASPPNLLTQAGSSGPVEFTLGFAPFLSQFGFTRPALLANPFVSHPAWQVTAFDAAGNVVGQVGEAEIDSSTNVGAAEFSLGAPGGPGIARVEFSSEGTGLTTFNGMLVDNLVLTTNQNALPPAVAITAPVSGLVLAAPPAVTITAAASGATGIASVSFYTNGVLLGADTTSPYSIQWENPAAGNYALTAVASNVLGLTSLSSPVSVVILSSASIFGIATPPASQTVAAGGSVTFTVVTTGTSPVTYQWSHGKAPIAGATSATLILSPPLNDGAAGDYTVAATSQGVTLVSAPAVLTIVDPPTITTQPAGQTISPGSALALNVAATGGGTFTYQWLLNRTAIPGATSSSFIIPSVQPLNSGNYQVVIANQAASALSAVAPVIVETAITIPANNNTFATRAAINPLLGPVAANNQSATVQAGAPLPGGLPGGNSIWFTWSPTYSGTVSLTTEGSDFDTVMAVYTGTALNTLKVVAADDDSGGFLTSLVSFNVTKGVPYQIAVDGFQDASGRVVLGLPAGNADRMLSPTSPTSVPVIVKGPASQTVAPGAKVTLSVQATSATKMNYQWFFQNVPIADATNSAFTISQLRPSLVGLYDVLVANAVGSAQSEPASLQIGVNSVGKPASAENKFLNASGAASPASLAVDITPLAAGGDTRGFSVSQVFSTVGAEAEPGEPEPCGQVGTASQWFVYTAPAAGMLQVNTDGSTFNTMIGVYTGPGTSFSTLVEAGCGYVTNYAVQGQPSVLIPNVAKGTTFYILVAGYQGASGVAQLQIGLGQPLSFTALPVSQTVTAGSNVTFAVATTGSTPSSYQWQLNGANLAGGTKQTYTVTAAPAAAAGNYTVIVSNVMGAVTSSPPASLTVQFAPDIVSGPSNVTVTVGQPAKFSVTAIGVNVKTNRLVSQWYFNAAPLAKATNLILSFAAASLTNNGSYYIVISNAYGIASSGPVFLTVLPKSSPVKGAFVTQGGGTTPLGVDDGVQAKADSSLSSISGTYSGLFYPTNGATAASSGFFTATIASQGDGAFSANILLDGNSYPFTGQFDASGNAYSLVPRAGKSSVSASLSLSIADGENQMTGVISNADWLSILKAGRVATNLVADDGSRFALVNAQGTGALVGSLTLTNTSSGTAFVTGNLPDGTGIFDVAPAVENAAVPLYVRLYSGQGLFMGWFSLTNSADATNFGQASWIRPGFTNAARLLIVK